MPSRHALRTGEEMMIERGRFVRGNVLEVSLAFLGAHLPSRAPGAPARRGLRDAKVFVCVNSCATASRCARRSGAPS